jgi:PAS domain S-box-containing protein
MVQNKPKNTLPFLSGGGEMGALIREKDWSKNPIGPPENWPQSLRTTLGIILNSKFPMFLFWGPELICFYNDAYRPSLGNEGKHPSILGVPAKGAWPEIWDIIKPLIDQVLTGGEATWSEDRLIPIYRNGRLEDVYWTFSYSPVKDESGNVGGVLVTCTETTEKIKVLNEIKESENQLSFAIDAAELATWDFNPVTNKFISNSRLKEWFGLPVKDEIELPLAIASIIEEDRKRIVDAINDCLAPGSNGSYNMEYTIKNQITGQQRRVVAKGKALFNKDNAAYRFSGTIQDITSKHVATKKIEDSEKRFRNLVEQAPLGITILRGPEFIVETANPTYLQLVDKKEAGFIGKPLFDSLPEVKTIVEPLLNNVLKTGVAYYDSELPVSLNRSGSLQLGYFSLVYHPLIENGKANGIMVVATEVTESVKAKHKLAESEKQFRNLVMQSPMAMTIMRGPELVIEMANREMLDKIWRKTEAQVLGKRAEDVFLTEQNKKSFELLRNVISTGITHKEKESIRIIEGNDGIRQFYLDLEYSPLFETDGSASGVFITVNDVTERVQARLAVEQSEARFRTMVENIPFPIGVYAGKEMKIVLANKAIMDVWGKGYDVIGKLFSDILPELQNQHIFERLDAVYQTGIPYHAKTSRVDLLIDGKLQPYYFNYNFLPLFDSNGKVYAVMNTAADVTDINIAKQKVEDAETRTRLAAEATELATWDLDLNTREIIYSSRLAEIFGHPKHKKISHVDMRNQVHEEDKEIVEKAFDKAMASGIYKYEARVVKPDNTICWVRTQGKVFFDDDNEPVKMIGTLRDLTEEKQAQQQLVESERKFRLLADSMPQHIWTSDIQGNLNYYNKSVFDYSGLSLEQINKDGWLQIVHPDDRDENIKAWTRAITTGNDFLFEHRFRRYDGQYRWQLSRAIPQRDDMGNIQMWVGTSTDIQDQKEFTYHLEKLVQERTSELELKNKELEKMNGELQSFAYVSSHDLQEPLRKIQTFAGRILETEGEHFTDTGKNYFERMQDAAQRMQQLINDLLLYSRTSTTERKYENTDLADIIADVRKELKDDFDQKQGTLEIGKMCKVNIIRFQFKQLLTNLISNSLKFTRPNVPPHVVIHSEIEAGNTICIENINPALYYCHISITDNGIGFAPRYKEKIFDVFQRLHGRSEYTGTGIGLAIVKKIVENHNGVITANGTEGEGATFDIYLPV